MIFGFFTLFVALVISAVAAYYSIVGLTAIFSAAVIPIIIMGAALEVGKVTAAVWLKMYWARASITYKLYLVPAVAFLMLLTSMGIFGFLSKAHSDQSLVSGDSMAKVAIYDEKIKTERETIDANRKALKQLDEAVDQVMGRSTSETGAERAVQIRRSQQAERGRLLKEIGEAQKRISSLNEERAPIAAEFRKVEAEVGPIKYIAALVYGDNPDATVLEKAVRLVIIIIVAVFDPLALVLILAAQQSLRWVKEDKEKDNTLPVYTYENFEKPTEEELAEIEAAKEHSEEQATESEVGTQQPEQSLLEKYPYLTKPFTHFINTKPMVYKPEEEKKPQDPHPVGWMYSHVAEKEKAVEPDLTVYDNERLVTNMDKELLSAEDIKNDPGVKEFFDRGRAVAQALDRGDPLPEFANEATTQVEVSEKKNKGPSWTPPVKEIYVPPETMERLPKDIPVVAEAADLRKNKSGLQADNEENNTGVKAHFGIEFPNNPEKGELFLRVDALPTRLYKYNGSSWIEVDKKLTDTYLYNDEYIKFLIDQIATGLIDPDDLSAGERDQIEEHLKNNG